MKFSVTILCACAAFAATGAACQAQSAAASLPNTTLIPEKTRTADYSALGSLPDWSGIWTLDFPKRGDAPPGAAVVDSYGRRRVEGAGGRGGEKRRAADRERELRAAGHAANHVPAVRRGISVYAGARDDHSGSVHAGAARLYRRARPSGRSRSDVQRQFDRTLGRRHAGDRHDRPGPQAAARLQSVESWAESACGRKNSADQSRLRSKIA